VHSICFYTQIKFVTQSDTTVVRWCSNWYLCVCWWLPWFCLVFLIQLVSIFLIPYNHTFFAFFTPEQITSFQPLGEWFIDVQHFYREIMIFLQNQGNHQQAHRYQFEHHLLEQNINFILILNLIKIRPLTSTSSPFFTGILRHGRSPEIQ
jgi:hypothetical protein